VARFYAAPRLRLERVVIVLLLHLTQTYLYGAYKRGAVELLWISGCILLALMLAMAFTGYLLPWDQKAYFATTVGTNMASDVPLIGTWLKRFMRGGDEMGTLTVSRFFVAHVFILPAVLIAFIATHVYLFRKAGAAGPPSEDPVNPKLPTQRFYPRQVVMDTIVALVMILILGSFAHFAPTELGPKANPADTQYIPRPEWYYLPIFQWLKYWRGPYAIIGIVVIPAVTAALLVFVPFIDRRLERRAWRRPIAVGVFVLILAGFVAMGLMSVRDDRRDPSIAQQVAKQGERLSNSCANHSNQKVQRPRYLRLLSRLSTHSLPREKKFMKANRVTPATVKTASALRRGRNSAARLHENRQRNYHSFFGIPPTK
jgi:Cytochrome b subunit of the bc complex